MNDIEFLSFIESIGFVYEKNKNFQLIYKLDKYDLCITTCFTLYSYDLILNVQRGVTRKIISKTYSEILDDKSIFISLLREERLKDIGI